MRTTVQDRREEALQAGFRALNGRIDLDYDSFRSRLEPWTVRAFCDGDNVIGMLMTKDDELHVAVVPEVRGKWLSRRLVREVFAPILVKYGKVRTKVAANNARGADFVRRLREGFGSLEFDPTTALAAASAAGGLLQADAASQAGQVQANAANNATQAQLQMFNTQNQQQAPYRQAGYSSLGALLYGLGLGGSPSGVSGGAMPTPAQFTTAGTGGPSETITAGEGPQFSFSPQAPGVFDQNGYNAALSAYNAQQGAPAGAGFDSGYFSHQFNANDLNSTLAPNYQFMLQQGLGAAGNQLSKAGGALSGNTLQGLTQFAENYAGNAYQQAFQNYTANQANIFNRLSDVAGFGQTANQATSQLAGSLAPSIANTITGQGAATASGLVGSANALSGAGNNALGWYTLNNYLNPGGVTVGNPGGVTQIGDAGAS